MSKLKPIVFTAMPFGRRRDLVSGNEIDFDDIYERAIVPAAQQVGLEIIRGDDEATGGVIMKAVYERLLLAEIVIADLTLQNPNVLYEVGVRHCAKPKSTIITFLDSTPPPFDLAMVRGIPYKLVDGVMTEENAAELTNGLTKRLEIALKAQEEVDSPLPQYFPEFSYAQFPLELTETFQERLKGVAQIRSTIAAARTSRNSDAARQILLNIEEVIGSPNDANIELFVDLMFAYRDHEAWDDMIRATDVLVGFGSTRTPVVIQQRALALNRRKQEGDVNLAETELLDLISRYGESSETCGIMGRIYKDRYQEAAGYNADKTNHEVALQSLIRGNTTAMGYLGRAIGWYEQGFKADPRDFYPGVNESTLRFVRNRDEDRERLEMLLPAAIFSVARVGDDLTADYWLHATTLELLILNEDWELTGRALELSFACDAPIWMLKSTANNLRLIREARRMRGEEIGRVDAILMEFPS